MMASEVDLIDGRSSHDEGVVYGEKVKSIEEYYKFYKDLASPIKVE